VVALQQAADLRDLGLVREREELDHLLVADALEAAARSPSLAAFVKDVGNAARHARREVAARPADDHRPAAGHVLATVVADALHHGRALSCGRRSAAAMPRM
jgi:hypothetical protein